MFLSAIYYAAALVVLGACATSQDSFAPIKAKRQIYREQVLPAFGGKIPEDAFRVDRLALNRLNALGISIPDGVLLEHRPEEKHHGSHRHDPDLEASVIKLVQTPDGRYVPPEGQHTHNHNQVESTYVIRPPVGYKHHVQPQKPRPGTISIPTNQNYNLQSYNLQSHNLQSHNLQSHNLQSYNLPSHNLQSHNLQSQNLQSYNNPSSYDNHATYGYNDVYSFMNQYDVPSFYSKPSMSQVWGGFGVLFPDFLARHLREAKPPQGVHATGPEGGLISDYTLVTNQVSEYPDYQTMPTTKFVCDRSGQLQPDPEAKCQVFHLCHYDGQKESFLCPVGTRFDAKTSECNPWHMTPCQPKGR
ncbi:unnamed protein product [Bemisia tabaci]|uniref:Chitin-binding type-2 domain-containing protein n=1 Tax=Bemisia tabaci TaxID=7038 RepID=A0A9P0AE06_BEMTA|nr:unnamed protein product [Bemisia tabaci]